jgi:hypothetical protein
MPAIRIFVNEKSAHFRAFPQLLSRAFSADYRDVPVEIVVQKTQFVASVSEPIGT